MAYFLPDGNIWLVLRHMKKQRWYRNASQWFPHDSLIDVAARTLHSGMVLSNPNAPIGYRVPLIQIIEKWLDQCYESEPAYILTDE